MSRAAPSLEVLLARVDELAPQVREAQDEMDRTCQLPESLVVAFDRAELFKLWVPEELGGYSMEPTTALRVFEAMAQVDGSAGWCLAPGNVAGLYIGFASESAAREMAREPSIVFGAGSVAGEGRAVSVDGGFRLSGRWAYCTNSYLSSWNVGSFTLVDDGGEASPGPDGTPETRLFYFPGHKTEIVPTWDTGGLRGTASHDFLLRDAVVPEHYGFNRHAKGWPKSPMYADGTSIWSHAAFSVVSLGIAKSALRAFVEIAKTRVPTATTSRLCENPIVRDRISRVDAALRAADRLYWTEVAETWRQQCAGEPISAARQAQLSQTYTHLGDTCRTVAQSVYRLAGGASVFRSCPLDRCLRDIHVAGQHQAVGEKNHEKAGRYLLGLED